MLGFVSRGKVWYYFELEEIEVRDACLPGGQELFLMVELDNRDRVTSSLGATPACRALLPRRGFIAFLPAGILGHGWHLGHGWTRLLDVDLEESY